MATCEESAASLKTLYDRSRDQIEILKTKVHCLDMELKNAEDAKSTVVENISSSFHNIKRMIQSRKHAILKQVNASYEVYFKRLNKAKEQVDRSIRQLMEICRQSNDETHTNLSLLDVESTLLKLRELYITLLSESDQSLTETTPNMKCSFELHQPTVQSLDKIGQLVLLSERVLEWEDIDVGASSDSAVGDNFEPIYLLPQKECLFILDANNTVYKLRDNGEIILKFCVDKRLEIHSTHSMVLSNREILISVPKSNCIKLFSFAGEAIQDLHRFDGMTDKFLRPQGVVVTPNRSIFVADSGNNRVCVSQNNLMHSFYIGTDSSIHAKLFEPTHLIITDDQVLLVLHKGPDQIHAYSLSGEFLFRTGLALESYAITSISVSHSEKDKLLITTEGLTGRGVMLFDQNMTAGWDILRNEHSCYPITVAIGNGGSIIVHDPEIGTIRKLIFLK